MLGIFLTPLIRQPVEDNHPPMEVKIQDTVVRQSPVEHLRGLRRHEEKEEL